MKRITISLLLSGYFLMASAIPVFAHGGGEGEAFNGKMYVQQSIVALVQRQPNMGVIESKLDAVIENQKQADGVDIEKVKEAQSSVKQMKYEEAKALLFQSIGESPMGENPNLGSSLQEYKKDFTNQTSNYLLLVTSILSFSIGGLILKQTQRG